MVAEADADNADGRGAARECGAYVADERANPRVVRVRVKVRPADQQCVDRVEWREAPWRRRLPAAVIDVNRDGRGGGGGGGDGSVRVVVMVVEFKVGAIPLYLLLVAVAADTLLGACPSGEDVMLGDMQGGGERHGREGGGEQSRVQVGIGPVGRDDGRQQLVTLENGEPHRRRAALRGRGGIHSCLFCLLSYPFPAACLQLLFACSRSGRSLGRNSGKEGRGPCE